MSNAGAEQVRFRCAIAAVNSEENIRVFSQDIKGGIREVTCQNGQWHGGSERDVIAHGILGTPLAAVCRNMQEMIHVFFIGEGDVLREVCRQSDGKWHHGELDQSQIRVAPYSMLAACHTGQRGQNGGQSNEHGEIRLFAQMQNNEIQEFCCDERGRWNKMSNVGRALPGTAMACTIMQGQGQGQNGNMTMKLIYQDDNMNIMEARCNQNKKWQAHHEIVRQALPRTDLTLVCCTDNENNNNNNNNNTELRLYYVDRNNRMKEMVQKCQNQNQDQDNWTKGQFDEHCVSGSQVAAVAWGKNNQCNIRVYFQHGRYVTAISEWMCKGQGKGRWEQGKEALPPADKQQQQ
ncbi:fucose-specific lectin [Aspergillus multicolor]|uniref:fucose-specific lectin n=1 Tax=Aspergillus multicolor TaxID=41759 RepID=UPI003CCCDE84